MGPRPRCQFQRFRWGRPVRLQPTMGRLAWRAGTRYLRRQRQREDGERPRRDDLTFADAEPHQQRGSERELPLAWLGSGPDRMARLAGPAALWHRWTCVDPFRAKYKRNN